MRLTVAIHEDSKAKGNHLAMTQGYSEADALTYREPTWQDADGKRYCMACFLAREEFLTRVRGPLSRPAWDVNSKVDLTRAGQAQNMIELWTPDMGGQPPSANPTKLLAVAGDDGPAAARSMGLTPIPTEI